MGTERRQGPHPGPLPRKRARGGGLTACLALLLLSTVACADAMRCGSRLIGEGDSIEKVLQYCGEPTEQTRTYIVRRPRFERGGQEYSFPGEEEVPVDLWTYDFGPDKLMMRVRMIAGKVDSIETLEYGTNR